MACSSEFGQDGIALTELTAESIALTGPSGSLPGTGQCDEDLMTLAKQYAPFVYFHSNEKNYASSIQYVLSNSFLVGPGGGTIPTEQNIGNFDSGDFNSGVYDGFRLLIDSDAYGGQRNNFQVYLHIYRRGSGTEFQYWFFFPYDGRYDEVAGHQGDWEHVTVRLNSSCQLEGVYYSAHSAGQSAGWIEGGHEFWNGTHPVIFCAKKSHGFWPTAGKHMYGFLGWWDSTDRGYGIDTEPGIVLVEDRTGTVTPAPTSPSWLNYKGKWGWDNDSPRGPRAKNGRNEWKLDPSPAYFCSDSSCPPGYICSYTGSCVPDPSQTCESTGCPLGYVCLSGQCVGM